MARMYWIELERYERGEQIPTLDRLYRLAGLLGTTLYELVPPQAEDMEEELSALFGEHQQLNLGHKTRGEER